jgi:hypothetical protein
MGGTCNTYHKLKKKKIVENLKETNHFRDLGKDGKVIFKWNREERVAYLVQSNGCTLSAI